MGSCSDASELGLSLRVSEVPVQVGTSCVLVLVGSFWL